MRKLGTIECEITSRCNLRCIHCYASAGECQPIDIPPNLVKSWMDQLLEFQPYAFDIVGGEPFLYPYLWEVLEHAKSIGLPVIINTNATTINRETVTTLKSCNPDVSIAVSLDGPNDTINDTIRGKGSFNKAMRGVELFKNKDFPVLFMFIVNRLNWRVFDKYVELAIREGIQEIYVDRFIGVGRGEKNLHFLDMKSKEWCEALRIINEVVQAYKPKIDFYVEESITGGECTAGRSHFSIGWDCIVVPCGHFKYYKPFHLGNAATEPLKTIFDRGYKLMQTNPAKCAQCIKFAKQCGGGCKATALTMTGSANNPDPIICAYFWGLTTQPATSVTQQHQLPKIN